MKKLLAIFAIFMFIGTISVSANTVLIKNKPVTLDKGSFTGEIGYPENKEWVKIGELSGTYTQKNKIYKFEGAWEITEGKLAGLSGSIVGFFGKNILIGKITITESGKKAPIVGFIGFDKTNQTFKSRFMSIDGPIFYSKGTYQ